MSDGNDSVVLSGEVNKQADSEKVVLAIENIDGVETVDNQITVAAPSQKFHITFFIRRLAA
ncbi:BON domain-containing protein [Flavobacterium sp.]|uniref:BON domain-containing protein n=1 Tax=Flavobacterium sp. TaxID=239 RepID=UPI00375190FD